MSIHDDHKQPEVIWEDDCRDNPVSPEISASDRSHFLPSQNVRKRAVRDRVDNQVIFEKFIGRDAMQINKWSLDGNRTRVPAVGLAACLRPSRGMARQRHASHL